MILKYGRTERSRISLGTIGCALTHLSLWKLCVDNNYPYIIIADDIIIKRLNDKDIKYTKCFIHIIWKILFDKISTI